MKTLNRSWKLTTLVALTLIIAIGAFWEGSRTAAQDDQDQISNLTRPELQVGLQVREAANVVGLIIQGGITRGQTLRFHFFLPAECSTNQDGGAGVSERLRLTVFDTQGGVLASTILVVSGPNQNGPARFAQFDLNADQIPQEKFDQTGRVQFTGVLGALISTNPGPPQIPGPHVRGVLTGELFDNLTGKTTAHIPGAPLLECGGRRR